MIKAYIHRNNKGDIYGFKVNNHGDPVVCSAVSILTFNTVNSIEEFTEVKFSVDMDEGGYMELIVEDINNGEYNHDVDLLLESLVLGLKGIELDYKDDIKVFD